MSPEFKILTINLVFLGFAYFWAYPSLPEKTLRVILVRSVAISAAALFVSAALFFERGVTFNLLFFDTNWFVFAAVTLCTIEIPFFMWFNQQYDITFDEEDDP